MDFHRSSVSNVNFFVLTNRWSPILLSKLSESYAVLGKWIKYTCKFWYPWTFKEI